MAEIVPFQQCNPYCFNPLGQQRPNDCEEELLGSSDAALFLLCNHQLLDPSDPLQVQAEIDAGRARLVKNVKISMAAPSPIKVPSQIGGRLDKLVNYDRTATLIDGNISPENVEFYAPLLTGLPLGGMLIYEKGTEQSDVQYVTFIDSVVNLEGGRVLPETDTEFQRFEIKILWRRKEEPRQFIAPAGIFA